METELVKNGNKDLDFLKIAFFKSFLGALFWVLSRCNLFFLLKKTDGTTPAVGNKMINY